MTAKILVVDDQAGPRESLRMILNHEHDVRVASCGRDALEMIREDPPDLVFLDIRMPEMEGTEVLRRIKEIAPDCEVAMITAYAAVRSAQRAIRLGALDYITKPFGVAEVEEVVERTISRRREQREGRLLLEQLSGTIAQLSEQLSGGPERRSSSDESLAHGLATAHSSIEDQLEEVLRLSSIGEVAAEVAHDMNNFLSTILFRIEIMLLDLDQAQEIDAQVLADGLKQIALAARDGGEALDRISAFSGADPYDPTDNVSLNEVLRDAVELSRGRVDPSDGGELVFDLGDLPPIRGSAPGLRTVFTNLVINAWHALSDTGRPGNITIRTRAEGDEVFAQIIDEGVGMSEEVLSHLAEPFFTTKGEGGTGLGLTVSHKVVAQHHGSINFESSPGEGTTVTVTLPIAPPAGSHGNDADRAVMIVDDQAGMLRLTQEVLQGQGHTVLCESSAEGALETFREIADDPAQETPRVVVTDLRMPGMQGIELAHSIKQISPETAIILLSAFIEEAEPKALDVAEAVLEKPCDLRELSRIVHRLLAGGGL